jgi:hypothetical protein
MCSFANGVIKIMSDFVLVVSKSSNHPLDRLNFNFMRHLNRNQITDQLQASSSSETVNVDLFNFFDNIFNWYLGLKDGKYRHNTKFLNLTFHFLGVSDSPSLCLKLLPSFKSVGKVYLQVRFILVGWTHSLKFVAGSFLQWFGRFWIFEARRDVQLNQELGFGCHGVKSFL